MNNKTVEINGEEFEISIKVRDIEFRMDKKEKNGGFMSRYFSISFEELPEKTRNEIEEFILSKGTERNIF